MIYRTIVTVLTLAALTTLALGVVSYWHGIPENTLWIDTDDESERVHFAIVSGVIHLVHAGPRQIGAGLYEEEWGGFYVKRRGLGKVDAAGVGAPFWAPFVLLSIIPFVAFIRGPVRRRRRRKQGRCVRCGYSLTGLTESRCPECGTEFPALTSSTGQTCDSVPE